MNFLVSGLIFSTVAAIVAGCATTPTQRGGVQPPAGFDPDAPALPKDAPAATKLNTPVSSQTTGAVVGNRATFKEESLGPPSAKAPAAMEELVPYGQKQEAASPEETVADNATTAEPVEHATSLGPMGTGPSKRYISADVINIRSKPNRFSQAVGTLHKGDEVHVTIRGDWAKIQEGQWVRSRWLSKTKPSVSGARAQSKPRITTVPKKQSPKKKPSRHKPKPKKKPQP